MNFLELAMVYVKDLLCPLGFLTCAWMDDGMGGGGCLRQEKLEKGEEEKGANIRMKKLPRQLRGRRVLCCGEK